MITDKRVMLATGIITHRSEMMPLRGSPTSPSDRDPLGRMLGYGTMILEWAGQIQGPERIDYMPRPEEMYEALTAMAFGDKPRTRSHWLRKPRR